MKRTLLPMLLVVAGTAVVWGQDQNAGPEPDGQYDTGRAVARISILNGDVSVRRGDSGDVVAAAINGPLMADDRILTGSSSRAEVELDFANVVRIGPNSEVRFSGMDIKNFQMQVAAGTVTFRVLRPSQAQTEVDTPSVAVHPLRQGIYRLTVRDDGSSEITVRAGEAEIYSPNGSERLQSGQTMNARGTGAETEFQIVRAIPPDNWDRWSEDRDRYMERSASYQHVSPDVYGAEDLDQNGQWVTDPTYGSVWSPSVAPGWAPYQNGRWVWEDYYGWTWVSADPWGWAPYHYGRWFWGGPGWCWYPGPAFGRHYWSPALVGFFGWGGGVGVGFGFGGVGWVPLAPFEVFHPWWGRGFYGGFRNGGFGRTTIVNNVNIVNSFRNAGIHGAVTGANVGDFGRRGQFTSLNRSQIQSAGLVHGALPVAPDRSSLRMSDRAASGNFPQSRASSFASHSQAPRAEHFSFDQQQRSMQQMSRGNFQSGSAANSPAGARSTPNAGGGWQRYGDRPGASGGGTPNNSANDSFRGSGNANTSSPATHGWGRFGEPIHGNTGGAAQSQPQSQSQAGGGWRNLDNSRPSSNNFAGRENSGGGGQGIRISPPIVQQRTPSYSAPAPNYQAAPRSFGGGGGGGFQAPRSNGGGGSAPRSAPSGGGGHSNGGGGGHSSGGGGGHSSGGHR